MRESRTFAERTKVLKSDEVTKKYFLVYEGSETEILYFDAIYSLREEVGINPLIELIPIIRSFSEEGWSNPKKILDRVIENLQESKEKCISYETLLNRIMDYLYEMKVITTSRVLAQNIWKTMQQTCTEQFQKSLKDIVEDIESSCNTLLEALKNEYEIVNVVEEISEIIKDGGLTYEEGFDKICLIVDRDKESFVATPENNQYKYVMDKCQEMGFYFCVTNPCFEFWLLLHFEEVFKLDKKKLLDNPKVTAKRRYAEDEFEIGMIEGNMRKYLKKYWLFAVLAPLFMTGEVLMDLLQPKMMSKIVDEGVLGLSNNNVGDLHLVITIGLQMIGLLLIGGLCGVLSGVFANMCSQNFGNDIRKDAFSKIMKLPFEQMDQFSTGSLITRVTNDITQLQNLVSQCIRGFVRTFLLFLGGIGCMLMLDLSFAVVVACALPLILICVVYFISKANPKFSILQAKLDRLNNVMQENVSGSRVVKAYTKEAYEQERFEKANDELVNTQLDVLLLFSYMTPIMNVILNVSVVAVIWVGGMEVQASAVTPGDVMAAVTYISQILNAVMRMTMIFQTVSRGVASGRRVQEILQCDPSIADGSFEGETEIKGKVEFKDVSFSYPGMGEEKILEHFTLTIQPGETLAIMGATGCGKSTLVNLIPRFYDATEGQVLVDGVDVKQYKLETLRDKIAVALQKSEIFHMSIGENLSWGNPKADKGMLEHAAETAQAMEFIQSKPEGMNTEVSQAGTSLSGGQKQRLSIGRAVLKGAEILIFDDATSALDLKTEAKLYEALKKDYPNTTKIIIAQRIASVKDADRIAVMENGRLADCGNHEELLKNSKIYQDIYDSQMKNGGETDGF